MTAANLERARHLPAAVIDPRVHSEAECAAAARLVPADAARVAIDGMQIGYFHQRKRGGFGFTARRLHEIERLIELRHGGPCDTDDGEIYFTLAVHCLMPRELQRSAGRPDPVARIIEGVTAWCERWLPRLPRLAMTQGIEAALSMPRLFRADTAAKMLRVTQAERRAADIATIGAIDADAEERARLRKERHAARSRERREVARASGTTQPRSEYEAASVAAECRRLGISRATFYRRRKAEAAAANAAPPADMEACDTSRAQHEDSSRVAHGTCLTPPKARPTPPHAGAPYRAKRGGCPIEVRATVARSPTSPQFCGHIPRHRLN